MTESSDPSLTDAALDRQAKTPDDQTPRYQTLHLVSRSPLQGVVFQDAIRIASECDALLLMQDAVYALLPGLHDDWQALVANQMPCFALREDVQARGFSIDDANVTLVDYNGMIKLVAASKKTCSWF
jgi:tRNA 2-thiouridine synthesizing protein B